MNTKQLVAFAIGVAVGVYIVPRIMASVAAQSSLTV